MNQEDVEIIEQLVNAGFPGVETAFEHKFITNVNNLAEFILSSNRKQQKYIIIPYQNGWFLITEVLQ